MMLIDASRPQASLQVNRIRLAELWPTATVAWATRHRTSQRAPIFQRMPTYPAQPN